MSYTGIYISDSDVLAAMGSEAYMRVFDRDGNGTADDVAVAAAIQAAENNVNVILKASHDTPFTDAPGIVKQLCVQMVPWEATKFWPSNGMEPSPYRLMYQDARALLKDIAKDQTARIVEHKPEPIGSATAHVFAPSTQFNSSSAEDSGKFGDF